MHRRREFLGTTAAGLLALRAMHAQSPKPVAIPGLEVGETTRSFALRNVTVIDGTGAPARPGVTVTIAGTGIRSIDSTAETPRDANIPTIDAAGKFLIPGLWDMHAHSQAGVVSPLFIPNGIVGVRIMRGFPGDVTARAEIAAGKRLGPRARVASPILNGAGDPGRGPRPSWWVVTTPEEARTAVQRSIEGGADFIKIHSRLQRDSYFAMADESTRRGVPFVGHVPWPLTPEECSNAGQRCVEHTFGLEYAYAPGYAAWRENWIKDPLRVAPLDLRTRVEGFNLARIASLLAVLRKNKTCVCPTLTASFGLAGDPRLADDARLKYVDRAQRTAWANAVNNPELPLARRAHQQFVELVGAMHKEGVGLLPGTDPYVAYVIPGFALHDELHLLVASGLSPMDALRAATSRAAEFLGLLDSLGTVAPGKLAELVLLDANPLDDITNTTRINAVFTGGRVYRRSALNAILTAVETNATN